MPEYVAAAGIIGSLLLNWKNSEDYQDMLDEQQAAEEEAQQRQYEANMQTYNRSMGNIDDAISYWAGLEEDPRSHPGWESYERQLNQMASKRQEEMEDELTRRGITGGAQTDVLRDVEEYVQSNLANTLLDISRTASLKQLDLEGMRPAVPYLGQPNYQGLVNLGSAYGSPPQLPAMDLSGLGMIMALENQNQQGNQLPTTAQPGSQTQMPTGGGAGDPYFTLGDETVFWNLW